jgi:hypothetical protein
MTCDPFSEGLSDLIDGTLAAERRAEVEAHVDSCPVCRHVVADLRRLRNAVGALEPHTPPDRVWVRIATSLRARDGSGAPAADTAATPDAASGLGLAGRIGRRGWLAAAATVIVAAGLTVWMARTPGVPGAPAQLDTAALPAAAVQSIETELEAAEGHYLNAIAGLEQIAEAEGGVLDQDVADGLRQTMALLDGAIAESRTALLEEPASEPARASLFEALRRKVALLQDTISLMNEMRKGDEVGAGRIVEELNKS